MNYNYFLKCGIIYYYDKELIDLMWEQIIVINTFDFLLLENI